MAQFDTQVPETQGTYNIPAPHAVEDDSTANAIAGFGNLAIMAVNGAMATKAANTKAQATTQIASYTMQIGKLQDAVDQGVMSSQAARTRIRALRNQVIANNPQALPQIDSATTAALSKSGLGAAITDGTEQEQARSNLMGDMVKSGMVPDNIYSMPEEQQDSLIHAYQSIQAAKDQVQRDAAQVALVNAKLTTEQKKLGITSAQLGIRSQRQAYVTGDMQQKITSANLAMKALQLRGTQAIANGAQGYTTLYDAKIQAIRDQFDSSAKTPQDIANATHAVQLANAEISQAANLQGVGASSELISQVTAPLITYGNAAIAYFSGKEQADAVAQAKQQALDGAALSVLHASDPDSLKIIGATEVYKNVSSALISHYADGAFLKTVGLNSQNPTPNKDGSLPKVADLAVGKDNPAAYKTSSEYLNGMKAVVQKATLGTLTPDEQVWTKTQIRNVVNGIVAHASPSKTALDYNNIFKFLADPAVNAYVVKHPDVLKVPTDSKYGGPSDVLDHYYTMTIKKLLYKRFVADIGTITGMQPPPDPVQAGRGIGYTPTTKSVKDVVKADFSGGSVRFSAINPKDHMAVSAAERLNADVSPTLNTLVRGTATLQSTSDFRKVYEDYYANLFNPPSQTEEQ